MNLARVSANGQITVPAEIRRLLGIKSGDKILFFQNPNGEIVINNASAQAIYKAQKAFEGVAEQMGVEKRTMFRRWLMKSATERDSNENIGRYKYFDFSLTVSEVKTCKSSYLRFRTARNGFV